MRPQAAAALLNAFRARLVPLSDNLVAAVFPLMKIFPAAFCIERARRDGAIGPRSTLVESSSGTMALGLAIVAKWFCHRLIVVTDQACDRVLARRMQDLGARVEIVDAPAPVGGLQRARLDRVREICARGDDYLWVNQYDNAANPAAYASLAAQLAGEVGRIDCLIGTVGSGGSMCGTAEYLGALFSDLYVIGVDTFGSVLFGQPDRPRGLRGLGNSLLPRNLDHTRFDEVHWVSVQEAYTATRLLHQTTSLFCGGTSGACWMVARHWAEQHPDQRVVCLFPDDGHRYVHTIYDDEAMDAGGYWVPQLPAAPREVSDPRDAADTWSCLRWSLRSYADVVKEPCLITTAG
jgi:S-sulfo-L-cysteine synthase (3-phospho-L-serine-dependent)